MRTFTTADLNKQVGEVTNAAGRAPVVITRHRKPRFVLMSVEYYQHLQSKDDPRRVYGPGETPDNIAALFADQIGRLAQGEGYDDAP